MANNKAIPHNVDNHKGTRQINFVCAYTKKVKAETSNVIPRGFDLGEHYKHLLVLQ